MVTAYLMVLSDTTAPGISSRAFFSNSPPSIVTRYHSQNRGDKRRLFVGIHEHYRTGDPNFRLYGAVVDVIGGHTFHLTEATHEIKVICSDAVDQGQLAASLGEPDSVRLNLHRDGSESKQRHQSIRYGSHVYYPWK